MGARGSPGLPRGGRSLLPPTALTRRRARGVSECCPGPCPPQGRAGGGGPGAGACPLTASPGGSGGPGGGAKGSVLAPRLPRGFGLPGAPQEEAVSVSVCREWQDGARCLPPPHPLCSRRLSAPSTYLPSLSSAETAVSRPAPAETAVARPALPCGSRGVRMARAGSCKS